MPDILPFSEIQPTALPLVGGKGLNLALTAAAGFQVPPGFVVTTDAYRRLKTNVGFVMDDAFRQAVADAYAALGGCRVAVRSSATSEDGSDASFAGQQETVLGVEGIDAILAAIRRCWESLFAERAVAYRATRKIDDGQLAMAVVVQTLVPATVAGVLFTRDPQDPTGQQMSIEAAWGLGEAVVSGRVTPDRFILRFDTGEVLTRVPGMKLVEIDPLGNEKTVEQGRQSSLCLSDAELTQLAVMARRLEQFHSAPRDVEWAIAGGTIFLLQSRPITTAMAAEREAIRRQVIATTAELADPRGTVWVRHNLSESLPEPTPMTWAVVSRMIAENGAFGALNRDLGAHPDPMLGDLGAFDLIAGRPMANLARMPRLQFRNPPLEYPFAAYKADPDLALDPRPVLNPARDGVLSAILRIPSLTWRLWKISSTTRVQAESFAARFTGEIAPAFATEARAALAQDWNTFDAEVVRTAFHTWVDRTCVEFARESLKPTVFAEFIWGQLVETLTPKLGPVRANTVVIEGALGAKPPLETSVPDAIRDLTAGNLSREQFLKRFGHRGRQEMELSSPRWAEDPSSLDALAGGQTDALARRFADLSSKLDTLTAQPLDTRWERVVRDAKLSGPLLSRTNKLAGLLRTYLGLREAAKHYLMLGFAVLRRLLLEFDRRYQLNGGVFFLLPSELSGLISGADLSNTIGQRRRRRQVELSLDLPSVLFSDDLEAIGRPVPIPEGAETISGIPLSAGVGEGQALVLDHPIPPPAGEFVLVCPSTDPAWVPLFAKARAVVMETGGVLSHGAIVAREFGLPAVAGIPAITHRIRNGQHLRVDGNRGVVTVVAGAEPPPQEGLTDDLK